MKIKSLLLPVPRQGEKNDKWNKQHPELPWFHITMLVGGKNWFCNIIYDLVFRNLIQYTRCSKYKLCFFVRPMELRYYAKSRHSWMLNGSEGLEMPDKGRENSGEPEVSTLSSKEKWVNHYFWAQLIVFSWWSRLSKADQLRFGEALKENEEWIFECYKKGHCNIGQCFLIFDYDHRSSVKVDC